MKYGKRLSLAAFSAMALMALHAASGASATTFEIGGTTKNASISGTASLESGSSMLLKDTEGVSQNTCTSSGGEGSSTSPFTGSVLTGGPSTAFVSNCTRLVTIHQPGTLVLEWTSNTNGEVYSEDGTATVRVPLIGYVTCRTHETTPMGTLTGVSSGNATMHVNGVLDCGAIPSAVVEATYTITSPEGLGISS